MDIEYKWKQLSPIAIATRQGSDVRKIVYYPGLVCSAWRNHGDRAADITHGFIFRDSVILGPTCLAVRSSESNSTSAVDNTHWVPRNWSMTAVDHWRESTLKKYWGIVHLCGLISQIKILVNVASSGQEYHDDAQLLSTQSQDLTSEQKIKLYKHLRSWKVNMKAEDWNLEVEEAKLRLTHWRDGAFKVRVMKEVIKAYPSEDDRGDYNHIRDILDSLAKQLGRRPLTEKQGKLMLWIEGELFEGRVRFTQQQCEYMLK